jgi:hypothetical protein
MTQLYFNLYNHVNNINGIPTFWGLKSKLNSYQNDKQGSYIVNGLWYDLNEYYKKVSGHDINDNEWTSNLQWLYMFASTPSNYTLPLAYLSVFDTQEQADNYDVNNAHYSLYKIIEQTYNEKPNYGQNVSLTGNGNGFDLQLGNNKTYYLRIDIGNPTEKEYEYPFVDYRHQPFNSYRDSSKPSIYDNINDISCSNINAIHGIVYTGNSTTDVPFDINLNGKTSVMNFNTNNKGYNTSYLNYNEYFIISPHDNSKPVTPPQPVTKQATININSGNFELVTPISSKIDVGKQLLIQAVPNKTYLIDFDKTIIKYTDVNGNITNYKFSENSNSKVFNRKDGSSQTGVYAHIDSVENGTYDINIVVKHGFINIDYSSTPHTWLTIENSNTGLEQKITQLLIDTDYTLKVASDNNWTSTNVELDGGMYDSNMFHSNNQAKTGDTVKVLDSDLVANDVFTYGLTLSATETQNVVQTYAEINSTLDGASLNLSRLPVGKSSKLTITADDKHVLSVYSKNENFADAFYKIGESGQPQYRFMFDDNTHKSASCLIAPSDNSFITVSCVTKWSNQPETQRKQVPIKLTLTHCSSNTSSLPENTEEEFENGHIIEKTITLTADDGYIFDKDVIYYNYDLNGGNYFKDTAKATNKNTISFTMHAGAYDNLKYQLHKPEIIAVANPEKENVSTGLDSIHIYHMRNAELDNLSNKLISYFQSTASGDIEIQDYDYTRFINQVYRLPFSIPSSIEVDTTKVSAGLFNLNMNTKTIKEDHYDIDIGTIKIDSKDATSYNAIKATLYLPFISSVQLDINDIIGHTISITYRINLLNGMNTLIVENENGLIYNQNVNVATNLQLFGAYYDKNVGSLNSVLNNNLRQAYIVIERKTPITNLLTYPTNEHGLIGDYKGLTKFVNTQIHIDATFKEKQEILAQLEQGVNIK